MKSHETDKRPLFIPPKNKKEKMKEEYSRVCHVNNYVAKHSRVSLKTTEGGGMIARLWF